MQVFHVGVAERLVRREMGVLTPDTGVHDCPDNAGAVRVERPARGVGLHRDAGSVDVELHREVRPDPMNAALRPGDRYRIRRDQPRHLLHRQRATGVLLGEPRRFLAAADSLPQGCEALECGVCPQAVPKVDLCHHRDGRVRGQWQADPCALRIATQRRCDHPRGEKWLLISSRRCRVRAGGVRRGGPSPLRRLPHRIGMATSGLGQLSYILCVLPGDQSLGPQGSQSLADLTMPAWTVGVEDPVILPEPVGKPDRHLLDHGAFGFGSARRQIRQRHQHPIPPERRLFHEVQPTSQAATHGSTGSCRESRCHADVSGFAFRRLGLGLTDCLVGARTAGTMTGLKILLYVHCLTRDHRVDLPAWCGRVRGRTPDLTGRDTERRRARLRRVRRVRGSAPGRR